MIRGKRLEDLTAALRTRLGSEETVRQWLDTPHADLRNDPPELWLTRGIMGMLTPEEEGTLERIVSNAGLNGA
jgi:hypothetical protein